MGLEIGFSTGALYKSGLNETARIEAIRQMKCPAIELGFVKLADFTSKNLANLPIESLMGFEYISFHAPVFEYDKNIASYRILEQIADLDSKLAFNLVIFHPDTVIDFSVFKDLKFPVGFENMDNRKKSFKTPSEMEDLLTKYPDFRFVLDLNHAYSNDPTMKLAAEFCELVDLRLTQIHLSGYNGSHAPLYKTRQTEIIKAIPNLVPIILESVVSSATELRKEMLYNIVQIVANEPEWMGRVK